MGNCEVELQNGIGWNLEYMWSALTLELDYRLDYGLKLKWNYIL
jgi:hypothetical protein